MTDEELNLVLVVWEGSDKKPDDDDDGDDDDDENDAADDENDAADDEIIIHENYSDDNVETETSRSLDTSGIDVSPK